MRFAAAILIASVTTSARGDIRLMAAPEVDAVTGQTFLGATLSWVSDDGTALGIGTLASTPPPRAVSNYRPFVMKTDGTYQSLTPPAGTDYVINIVRARGSSGVVIGNIYSPTLSSGTSVRWDPGATSPVTLSGGNAVAVNASGSVLGYKSFPTTIYQNANNRFVRWDANSTSPVELGNLGLDADGVTRTIPSTILDNGTIYGVMDKYINGTRLSYRPVRYNPGSTVPIEMATIATSDPNDEWRIGNVNATAGIVTGIVYSTQGYFGVRWNAAGTVIQRLGSLGTDLFGNPATSGASGISDNGYMAGSGYVYTHDVVTGGQTFGSGAIRWMPNTTTPTKLGDLGIDVNGVGSSVGYGINTTATVVGYSTRYTNGKSPDQVATMWLGGSTTPIDLNTLAIANVTPGAASGTWRLTNAFGLTNTGFINGFADYDPDGSGPLSKRSRPFTALIPQAGSYGRGDANFDTKVNFDDLIILAQHYKQSNAAIAINVGDFNLDGQVNFDDLIALAQNYNKSFGGALTSGASENFAADWALAQSLVPEPVSIVVAVFPIIALRRRPGHQSEARGGHGRGV